MSVNQKYSVTVELSGASILVTNLSMSHTLGSPLPTASITVSHEDYTLISSYGTSLTELPPVKIIIAVAGAITYTYYGVLLNVGGNENEVSFGNTLQVAPNSYFATILTSSFSGIGNDEYLTNPFLFMQSIIQFFNAMIFPMLSLTPPLTLVGPVFTDPYNLPLQIAPRFTGMTCYDMLSAVARSFGLSVYFTWDNQVMISSMRSPVQSNTIITKNMTKNNNFALDMPLAIYGTKGWPM